MQFHAFDQETVYLFCGPPLYTVLAIARILSRFRSNAASSEGSSQSLLEPSLASATSSIWKTISRALS